jgi:nitroreductase
MAKDAGRPRLQLEKIVVLPGSSGDRRVLGTCWVATFNPEAARSVMKLPKEAEPVIFTPLVYPADQPGPKTRKPLGELVRYERW